MSSSSSIPKPSDGRSTRPTIHDVAKRAGVSLTTVSHAMSGNRAVAVATRQRVLKAVEELGYRPHTAATTLRTGISSTVALVVPDIANPFFADLARGAEDAAFERGWTVVLANTALQPTREVEQLAMCLGGGVDGLVYCSTTSGDPGVDDMRQRISQHRPVVYCDERVVEDQPGVFSDNVRGGRLAADHFAEIGVTEPLVLGGPQVLPTSRERVDGFVAGLAEHGVDITPDRVRWCDYTIDAGEHAATELLEEFPTADGIFGADDLLAIGALRACERLGRAVPADVRVCGFDDISIATLIDPPLTTIRQDATGLGRTAVNMLLDHIEHGAELTDAVLPVGLVRRSTT